MPYISEEDRKFYEDLVDEIEAMPIYTPGDLQYLIAVLIGSYMADKELRYSTMNDVMGALNGANMEYYREVVGPYEEKAIGNNGYISEYNVWRTE